MHATQHNLPNLANKHGCYQVLAELLMILFFSNTFISDGLYSITDMVCILVAS